MITISPTYLLIWRNELLWVSVLPCGVFSQEQTPPPLIHPCKSYNHDHRQTDLLLIALWQKET